VLKAHNRAATLFYYASSTGEMFPRPIEKTRDAGHLTPDFFNNISYLMLNLLTLPSLLFRHINTLSKKTLELRGFT